MSTPKTPLYCAMEEWQTYSTRNGWTVPDSFIAGLYEIITNLTTTGKLGTLLQVKRTLEEHAHDSNAHALALKDIYPAVYDQLYRLYRQYYTGSMDDMCHALYDVIAIADRGDVIGLTEDTKAVLAQHAHLLTNRHETDLSCHANTYLNQFPKATIKTLPSITLFQNAIQTAYYNQFLGTDGIVAYPVARSYCNEVGTYVFSVQYTRMSHSTILFSLLDNGIERYRIGTLENGGLYFDVIQQLDEGVVPSRVMTFPEPVDIPEYGVVHRKLVVSYDQECAYFRGTLHKKALWYPVGHTFHGDTFYVRNMVNKDIMPFVKSVLYYPTTIKDDETLIFLVD